MFLHLIKLNKCFLLQPSIHDIHFHILGELISLSEYIQQNLDSLDPRNNEVHEQFHRLQNLVLYEKYVLYYLKRESKDGQVISKQIKRLKDIYEGYVLDIKYLSSNKNPMKNEFCRGMNSSTNEGNRNSKDTITVEQPNPSHGNDLSLALKQEFRKRSSKEFGDKRKSVPQKRASFKLGESILITQYSILNSIQENPTKVSFDFLFNI